MTQTERIQAVMSILDVNLGQWIKWLNGLDDAALSALDDDVENAASGMIYSLQNPDEPESARTYLQGIATLNDENLANLVEMVQKVQ